MVVVYQVIKYESYEGTDVKATFSTLEEATKYKDLLNQDLTDLEIAIYGQSRNMFTRFQTEPTFIYDTVEEKITNHA